MIWYKRERWTENTVSQSAVSQSHLTGGNASVLFLFRIQFYSSLYYYILFLCLSEFPPPGGVFCPSTQYWCPGAVTLSSSSKTVCDVVGVAPPFACSYMSCVTPSALQQLVLKCTLTVGSGSDNTDPFHSDGRVGSVFNSVWCSVVANSVEFCWNGLRPEGSAPVGSSLKTYKLSFMSHWLNVIQV